MLFVESFACQLMPELRGFKKLSVACVATTNPVYLVFTENPMNPELVIRRADSEEVLQAHKVTEHLFPIVGDIIPEPVSVKRFEGSSYSVQKGVRGRPWFQLASTISSQSQWNDLRQRAIVALNQLHDGASKVQGWTGTCRPGDELRISLAQCKAVGTKISPKLERQVEHMSQMLDGVEALSAYPQHGDFCLNNLLIENDAVHIIDFEDFGMTSMPLFDEISLALSMFLQAPKNVNTTLKGELLSCTEEATAFFGIAAELLPGFFLYHLLWRLGSWSMGPRRKAYREWLLATLDNFASKPEIII